MTDQAKHTYDLFISYADADREWVERYVEAAVSRCQSARSGLPPGAGFLS